ncbi:MAG TPA: hypothetical protein VGJ96_09755 [Gemmatimonadaceae bacterium]|jgi:uncharacterized membrane protein
MTRLATLLLVVVACRGPSTDARPSSADSVRASATRAAYARGTLLVSADSTMRFAACGTTVERPVADTPASRLREAVNAVNGSLRDSLFVEFLADTLDERVVVRETLFATSLAEGPHCDRPREPFEWVAHGVEPFWRVTFDGTQLVLERPEPPRELVFDAQPADVRGALTTVAGTRSLGKVHSLKVGLLRESCRDGMSDAWFPFRAEVRVGDVALAGCARR